MNNNSPNKKIWLRLKRNNPAVLGIFIIVLFCIISVLAYVIAPDNSTDANTQHAMLAEIAPGSSFTFLKIKLDQEPQTNFFSFLNGKTPAYKTIPIETFSVTEKNELVINEYKGLGFPSISYNWPKEKWFSEKIEDNFESKTYILGSDQLGRDVFSRLIIGTRVSILVGLVAVVISTFLGLLIGSLAGFYRGWIDQFILWKISVFWSIPTLLLAMALYINLKDVFESSYIIIFIAIGFTMWVSMARIVRGQILSVREIQFIEAANSLGFSDRRIIVKHVLPNILAPVIVVAAANFANAILIEAGLSFLGLGIQPPTPSWGGMLSEFKDLVGTKLSYLAFFPGILIMLLVLSFNLVGNGLRDAIDVKK